MTTDQCQLTQQWTKVGEDGRLVIPAEFRKELGLEVGVSVLLQLVGDEIHVLTVPAAVRRVQEITRRYVPEGRMLSDELIEERRAERPLP